MLGVEHPERVCDCVDVEHALLPLVFPDLGKAFVDLVSIDRPIDDHMTYVNPLGAELSRHSLGDCAKARLGRSEAREGRPRSKRCSRPRKENTA